MSYTLNFKIEVIAYYEQGHTSNFGLISKLKGRAAMNKSFITDKPDNEKKLAKLKRENEDLRAQNAYLKKLEALLKEKEKALRKQSSSED